MKNIFSAFFSVFISASSIGQTITGIAPSAGTAGTTLSAQVTGSGLFFVTASPPGIRSVQLSNFSCNFFEGANVQLVDDDHFNVDFSLPADATNGAYDLSVKTEINPG